METRRDPNGVLPHFHIDVSKVSSRGVHAIIQQYRPDHDNLPKQVETKQDQETDYSLLFELMTVTEKAHEYLTLPGTQFPNFGRKGWEIERRLVIGQIMDSKRIVSELITQSKGLPIHILQDTGETVRGQIVASNDFNDGHWELEFKQENSPNTRTVYKTSEQLRDGYLAATQLDIEEPSIG